MEIGIKEFGICNLSVVPLRAEPSDKSEITSQLLFGDLFEILEKTEKWIRIITAYDEYEGWIDRKQFTSVSYEEYQAINSSSDILGLNACHPVKKHATGEILYLAAGSTVPRLENNRFIIKGEFYEILDGPVKHLKKEFSGEIEKFAKFYLHAPYLWGGRTLFGIDCSGFTQIVFKQFGLKLRRDASQQAEQGILVGFLPEVKPGDLAFFDNEEGRIVHVGIMLNPSTIIHASGKVRIDSIDDQGIYNAELKRYTHKLRIIKRFV